MMSFKWSHKYSTFFNAYYDLKKLLLTHLFSYLTWEDVKN